jgi:hypothetical protein
MRQSNQQRLDADMSPPPSAVMIVFPQSRRVHLVEKTAARMALAKSQERGEKLLAAAVRKQRAAMTRQPSRSASPSPAFSTPVSSAGSACG